MRDIVGRALRCFSEISSGRSAGDLSEDSPGLYSTRGHGDDEGELFIREILWRNIIPARIANSFSGGVYYADIVRCGD